MKNKKYLINEIFYSIQGEGFHTGTPAVFIRFSGCNLECSFCDTEHEAGSLYTMQDIVDAVSKYPSRVLILTGGEPSLQVESKLCHYLKVKGFTLHMETNGTKLIPTIVPYLDWITVSPKSSDYLLRWGNELKLVYTGQDLNKYMTGKFQHYYLQPCSMSNVEATIEEVKRRGRKWKLSLQVHKMAMIR